MEHLTWHQNQGFLLVRTSVLERGAGGAGACTLLGPEGPDVTLSGVLRFLVDLLLIRLRLVRWRVPPVL